MSPTADSLDAYRHQRAAGELTDAFHRHDMSRLEALTATQRATQAQARHELARYIDALWDDLKRRGLRPADNPDEYNAVAAMRDLMSSLYFGSILSVQQGACDPFDSRTEC